MASGRSSGSLCRCPAVHLYAMSTLAHPAGLILLQASANLHAVNCEPFVLMSPSSPLSEPVVYRLKAFLHSSDNVRVQIRNCF